MAHGVGEYKRIADDGRMRSGALPPRSQQSTIRSSLLIPAMSYTPYALVFERATNGELGSMTA